jgi:uncharacterized protein with GYD domain
MATFVMFGKYTPESLQQISAQRTDQAKSLVEKFGGKVEAMYATLGMNDLVCIVSLPGTDEAIKASAALSKMSGIAFSTAPAVPVDQFDRLMGEL